jgi:hypothetical protein
VDSARLESAVRVAAQKGDMRAKNVDAIAKSYREFVDLFERSKHTFAF